MTTEETTIAIDFGSTKIVTAHLNKNNRANIIIDEQTNRTLLNAIQLRGNKCTVGSGVDNGADVNATHTIRGIDLKLLLTNNDLDDFSLLRMETQPYPAFLVDDQKKERRFTLMQLIVLLLAKIKENAEDSLKTEVKQCYITVPTCYTPQQRLMMQDAGKMVGFEEVKIVDDTTAAALTYAFEKKIIKDPHKIFIVDVGATSTEAAIFLFEKSSITVQACKSEMNLGGNNFYARLMKYFVGEFKTKMGVDLTGKQYELFTLRTNCEELKRRLTSAEKAKVTIKSFHNGQPYDLQLTRTEFEDICDDIFTRIMNVVKEVLDQTNKSDIEKVILVGGGSRLPKIQKEIVSLMEGKQLSRVLNQDEATATGAAYYTLNKIDIHLLTQHDNEFLLEIQNNEKALNEFKSERINLEALCYRFKRELKNRNLDDQESKTILNKCNETLVWIKQTDYNNPTTTEMVKEKAIQLTKVNTNVESQPEKKKVLNDKVVELAKLYSYDNNQLTKIETGKERVVEPTKIDSDVTSQLEKIHVDNVEPTKTIQQNDGKIPVQSTEPELKLGWKIPMPLEGDIVERKINQEELVEPMDTGTQKELSLIQKIFQKGFTFYNNNQFSEASNIFTEVLNSKDIKDIDIERCFEMRARCYLQMEQFQLCINDLNLIRKTTRIQDILNITEHKLYEKKTLKIREQCKESIRSEDREQQFCALTLISDALQNKPQFQSISNIRYTSQLLHAKAMYNFVLGHFSLAIFDIYENMRLIHDIQDLTPQKHVMYKEVFEKMDTLKKVMKRNMGNKQSIKNMQIQLSYIEKCLKNCGYASNWFRAMFY